MKILLRNPIFHLFLIAIVGFLAYSNTFHVPFVFDDVHNIVENFFIKNPGNFIEPSKAKGSQLYSFFKSRYIGYLTFALNYRLNSLNVTGYHIFNLTIHILNAILVYWLVTLTLKTPAFSYQLSAISYQDHKEDEKIRRWEDKNFSSSQVLNFSTSIALFSALIFVSHPIQTQAVTYIVQRFASLATFFYLLAIVMYIKFRIHDTKKMHDAGYTIHDKENPTACIMDRESCIVSRASCIMYLASLFSAVLAMKTKEIAFTLPIVIILYEFMFFTESRFTIHDSRFTVHDSRFKRILYLIPIFLTMLIIPLTLIDIGIPAGELIEDVGKVTKGNTTLTRWEYLFTELRVVVTYIRLLFPPGNQNLDYDYPVYSSFFNPPI
ncbi:MAG: hypothetical protein HY754_14925, partial [Nitrospirae bacterium]|nr:hypothetical protein [Nitrospirota bacterium]